MPELRYQDIKSAVYIEAIIHLAETLLGIRLKNVKKYRYRQAPQVWVEHLGINEYCSDANFV